MAFLVPLAAAVLVVAVSTAIMVRRDRRRMPMSADGRRVEAVSARGPRENHRPARADTGRRPHERA
ncbi:hypothetical protein ACIBWG_07805 [Streptomyces griseoaurantiacus]|uniref:Uncharacterized protein n=1 Tax=Streptomyces griseoaurantiacus TaxID=68213 RepID=A0A1G7M3D6_9ACTN|nr:MULTISPECIES: hypothetical protein [Streptomyces]MDX3363897.1 hypothetical protein [Streptomyces sp. ME02-6978.2a]WTI30473.1 hypothetical protein OHA67_31140 [Streptomyces jietaisiensis]SDF56322.1 hypothetical protein SAMN05216260_10948 [Streptomyces jietaisiensis]